jgi:ATPase family associated with various cellular activities (AAA)
MQVEAFANNWAYLKVELNSLERLILGAVARQKKENKEADRMLRTPADRAAQYWLQGLMHIEGNIGYDSPPPARSAKPQSYNQQLDSRLAITHKMGKLLALPALCDRLQLSLFEKNLVLLGIAPEVHRRYGKLYEYLNGDDRHLLTIDLALRLLCRSDQEWRNARVKLHEDAPLINHNLVEILDRDDRPFLQRSIKLTDELVNYLLAEETLTGDIDRLLKTETPQVLVELPTPLQVFSSRHFAGHLVLPKGLQEQLELLAYELKHGRQVEIDWGFAGWHGQAMTGLVVLCVGAAGTGKTAAAQAIAQAAGFPLMQLDLRQDVALADVCQQLEHQPAPVLLVKHADRWLNRSEPCQDVADLRRFLGLRHQSGCLTLLSVPRSPVLSQFWRETIDQTLPFPKPNAQQRQAIWHRVLPPQVQVDLRVNWVELASHVLTGGEIAAIARMAAVIALAEQRDCLTGADLERSLQQYQGKQHQGKQRQGKRLTRPKSGS